MSERDEFFMRRALYLAEKGKYHVAPNPMVGAVIVHQDRIIGEGYHEKFGQAHAEVNAIAAVEDQNLLSESTLYVSLEPCSHHGKTPPCSDLIISKQIKEVVIAHQDPSEKVRGKGIDKLQKAGIAVRTGILEEEAKELNKRFIYFHQKKTPYITLKWAMTKDGFIGRSKSDSNRSDSWITNPLSKQLVHQWRAEEMGILVGKNTAIIDNPELNCREFYGRNPIRFLIDPQLEVPNNSKIFSNASKTVVLNQKKQEELGLISYVKYNEDLFQSLIDYCLKNNILSLLIEGGGLSLKHFIEKGLWNEAKVFVGQKEFHSGVPAPQFNHTPLRVEHLRDDLLFHYKKELY